MEHFTNRQPVLCPGGTHPARAGHILKGEYSSSAGFTDLLQRLPSGWAQHTVWC